MLGGGDVNPPVEDDVQTAYIFSVSGFSMFFRLAFKSGCVIYFLTEESIYEGSCPPEVMFGFL